MEPARADELHGGRRRPERMRRVGERGLSLVHVRYAELGNSDDYAYGSCGSCDVRRVLEHRAGILLGKLRPNDPNLECIEQSKPRSVVTGKIGVL